LVRVFNIKQVSRQTILGSSVEVSGLEPPNLEPLVAPDTLDNPGIFAPDQNWSPPRSLGRYKMVYSTTNTNITSFV
jgi:hypothetical protein